MRFGNGRPFSFLLLHLTFILLLFFALSIEEKSELDGHTAAATWLPETSGGGLSP